MAAFHLEMLFFCSIIILKNTLKMKKIIYYITVTMLCIIGLPFMIFCKNEWNCFGRKVDKFFGIESRHTRLYEEKYGRI